MVGETKLLATLSRLVKRTKADGVSVCAHARTRRVFRFAYGAIHQDLQQESVGVTIKAIRDRRIGVAGAETLEAASLDRCARAAADIARHAPQQRDLPALPSDVRIKDRKEHAASATRVTAAACVAKLKALLRICQGAGAALAGSLVTGEDEFAVVNSSGVACYAASTISGAKLVTMYRRLSGYASGTHHDITRLDLEALLKRSLKQSLSQAEPVTLPLGTYAVVLEPDAVAELVTWLGYTAFGAKAVEERTSCLAGRMGKQLMDRRLTIYDDGNDPGMARLPFDFEGTPKQRVTLIDGGRAAGIVYDTLYGLRFGCPSTGHGMVPGETDGPLPLHLGMEPGTATMEELIRACPRGLLIPRFHYVNGLLNPREAVMTGLKREGAWLIEDGRLTRPVTTMRFTQNMLEAFSQVAGVGQARRLIADPGQELGCALVPALHLKTFALTGRSDS